LPPIDTPQPVLARLGGSATVPDVVGLSLRDAVAVLSAAGIHVRPTGSGVVVIQRPIAGTSLDEASVVELTLERSPTPGPGGAR
jgi:beta-lactam-binding protein with PASTA domain